MCVFFAKRKKEASENVRNLTHEKNILCSRCLRSTLNSILSRVALTCLKKLSFVRKFIWDATQNFNIAF